MAREREKAKRGEKVSSARGQSRAKKKRMLSSSFSLLTSASLLSHPPHKQTDASYTTIAETAEWAALKEHVSEIEKT